MYRRISFALLAAIALLVSGCVVVQPSHTDETYRGNASQEQIYQVVVTTYLLDNVGLHAMDERINNEGIIEASFAGDVRRIRQVIAVTDWPAALHDGVATLLDTLAALAEALADDDLTTAGPLAAAAHEQQHDLSHEVERWLAEQGVGQEGSEHEH